jgi:hypothetical protein
MRTFLLLGLLLVATSAPAQIYRWTDAKGQVHYSNGTPPPGANAKAVAPDIKPGPSVESLECHTLRCQGERLDQRLARREELETRLATERAAAAPPRPRGLEFRKYIWIERGMSEGELLTIAGVPDATFWDPFIGKNYTYLPTVADPFTTSVFVVAGRVHNVERVRKF